MFRRPIKEVNAEFIAEEKYLDGIQRTVRESCVASGMSKKETASVLLSVEEAATNIIRHAYLYEKGIIRLRIIIYKKLVVFSLIDFGRSFQPGNSKTVDLNKLVESGRKGGLGFYMIQKIMDSVEYISTAGFNEIRMIKRIKDSSTASRRILRRTFTLRVKFSMWTFMIMSVIIAGSLYYFNNRISIQLYEHKAETITALGTTIADQATGYFLNERSDVEFDQMIVSYMRANPELKKLVLTDEMSLIRAHSGAFEYMLSKYNPPENIDDHIYYQAVPLPAGDSIFYHIVTPITTGSRELGKVYLTYSIATIEKQLESA